jgi:predicted PhzF superfamily epimerase YddE/YHI9
MHILEQSIRTDARLKEALGLCITGDAKPLKLFFSKKLDQSYTEKYLPMTYRKVFDTYEMNQVEKAAIASMLNNHQSVVSFNYVPRSETGKQKLVINISVLHDVKALEPIKSKLPLLYSEINRKAPQSAIGKLYLLDSMSGYQNV